MQTLRNVIDTIKNANITMKARQGIPAEQMAALKLIRNRLQDAICEENGGISSSTAARLPPNTVLGEKSTEILNELRSLMIQYDLIDENGDPTSVPVQVIVDFVEYFFGEGEKSTN